MKHRWRHLGTVLVLGTLVTAAFWPLEVEGDGDDPQAARQCEAKMDELNQALADGRATDVSFSERELNAHLAEILHRNPQVREPQGFTVGIDDLSVDVTDERASLFVHGRMSVVPFCLELRLVEQPAENGEPLVDVRSVRLGRLPLVPPIDLLALGHVKRLLGGLRYERLLYEHLSELEIGDGEIRVAVAASS